MGRSCRFDQVAGSVTGIMNLEGGGDDQMPSVPPVPVVNDNLVGWLIAGGIAEAPRRRSIEGGSWRVDCSLTRTALWILSMGVFDLDYAIHTAGTGTEHAFLPPELFTADTPLGHYQGVTEQVRMSKTPGRYDPVLLPLVPAIRSGGKPGFTELPVDGRGSVDMHSPSRHRIQGDSYYQPKPLRVQERARLHRLASVTATTGRSPVFALRRLGRRGLATRAVLPSPFVAPFGGDDKRVLLCGDSQGDVGSFLQTTSSAASARRKALRGRPVKGHDSRQRVGRLHQATEARPGRRRRPRPGGQILGRAPSRGPGDSRVTRNKDGDTDPVSQHRASNLKTYGRFMFPCCCWKCR